MFYVICAVLTLAAAVLVLRPLLRTRAQTPAEESKDIAIFRAQLEEIDRDVARGTLDATEAERTRTEVARRMLAADRARSESAAPMGAPGRDGSIVLSTIVGLLILGGAAFLYTSIGAPGYPDLPLKARLAASEEARDTRMSQADMIARMPPSPALERADPAYIEMIEQLRTAVIDNPDDLEGQRLLARHEANLGQFDAAIVAQEKVIALQDTPPIEDRMLLLDLMVYQVQGYVSPEAEAVARAILKDDPTNAAGRYYIGLLYDFTDRPDVAFRLWQELVDEGGNTPHTALARRMIENAAQRAGIDYTLPAAAAAPAGPMMRGPTAEDMDAAADMTPEERQQMIAGMVEQLSNRLATEGGSAQEWARLISALGVLGDTERAQAIYDEAKGRFEGQPDFETIVQAATQAGLQ
ncbi:MAG: c-type cytochrome biogenesis protein CcmI [Rhodobacterales bacterium]|nr:MAG: c-type cytochrome biogenesis protein CcmI [Rhodobacterales bacterium]